MDNLLVAKSLKENDNLSFVNGASGECVFEKVLNRYNLNHCLLRCTLTNNTKTREGIEGKCIQRVKVFRSVIWSLMLFLSVLFCYETGFHYALLAGLKFIL